MLLNRHARENYAIQIATTTTEGDPIAAADWEASFDGGTTYMPANVLTLAAPWTDTDGVTHEPGDLSEWLVAGPDAEVGSAVAVITASTDPLVRAIDNPEIIVREAPQIYLA